MASVGPRACAFVSAAAIALAACHGAAVGDAPQDSGQDATSEATSDSIADATDAPTDGTPALDAEAGAPSPSCSGLAATCAGSKDCCARAHVPGGAFLRSFDGVPDGGFEDESFPATVSDFDLDVFEVSVGRFRRFVDAYTGAPPASGAGKNPHDAIDPGWDTSWSSYLPASQSALDTELRCSSYASWTKSVGGNESKPINCVSWYVALAFCIWDGGRLPTEAEWNFAAAGGTDQRAYPWSTSATPLAIDDGDLVYGGVFPAPVGSKSPNGDGKYGHTDLAGNMWEWAFDADGAYPLPCDDCARHDLGPDFYRVIRGGGWDSDASLVRTAHRDKNGDNFVTDIVGMRCAYAP
jgi:formylglycine-generating enzyme required for sulfatase activity